jgi:CheY-like chemotaxis protein
LRLLVVDDHTLFRRGLIALLQADARFSVVAEAGDAGEAQRLAAQHQPDVILLDNHLPGVKGVDAIAGLREVAPADAGADADRERGRGRPGPGPARRRGGLPAQDGRHRGAGPGHPGPRRARPPSARR